MTVGRRRPGIKADQDPVNVPSIRSVPGRRAGCSGIVARAIVGVCALMWAAGSLSVAYASLMESATKIHCRQGQAHPQNGPGHCLSHCSAMDEQADDVRNRSSTPTCDGFVSESPQAVCTTGHLYQGVVSRGPPAWRR